MQMRDAGYWERFRRANPGLHGQAIARFAEAWANEMERQVVVCAPPGMGPLTVAQIAADACDYIRETGPGLSPFEHGVAVDLLGHSWEHGPELLAWHNRVVAGPSRRSGRFAARATAEGSTLNPAFYGLIHPTWRPWRRRRRLARRAP